MHISLKLVSFHSWFRFIISPANIAIFYCLVLATNWLDTHLHSKTFVGKTVRIMMIGRRSSGVQSTFKLNQIYAKEIVFQREQVTNNAKPVSDEALAKEQVEKRERCRPQWP